MEDQDQDHQNSHDGPEHVHGPGCNHDHEALTPIKRSTPKVGRNDPCFCGSQKKFKKCCGK
jgi:uncharacterized protein YecA (UPF0149 family)